MISLLLAASIQSLLDAAPPNSTVNVPQASYTEHVTINKPLTLDCQQSIITGSITFTPAANPSKATHCIMLGVDRPVFGWPLVGSGAPYASNITLVDNEVRKNPTSGTTFAVGTAAGNYPNNILIDNIRFKDASTRLMNLLSLYGNTNEVRNSYFTGTTIGHIVVSSSVGPVLFHHNVAENITCIYNKPLTYDGDGCIQIYNANYSIYNNLFHNVYGGDTTQRAVLILRHNPTSSRNTYGLIYHNTFIIDANGGGPFNSAIEVTNAIASGEFKDNIFKGPFGKLAEPRSGVFRFVTKPSPANHHNLYFGAIRNFGSEGGSLGPFDMVGADPQLDPVTFIPAVGSPVCKKASDGGDIGAFPCGGVSPSPTPSPTPSPIVSPTPTPLPSPTPTPTPQPSPSPSPSPSGFDVTLHCTGVPGTCTGVTK